MSSPRNVLAVPAAEGTPSIVNMPFITSGQQFGSPPRADAALPRAAASAAAPRPPPLSPNAKLERFQKKMLEAVEKAAAEGRVQVPRARSKSMLHPSVNGSQAGEGVSARAEEAARSRSKSFGQPHAPRSTLPIVHTPSSEGTPSIVNMQYLTSGSHFDPRRQQPSHEADLPLAGPLSKNTKLDRFYNMMLGAMQNVPLPAGAVPRAPNAA